MPRQDHDSLEGKHEDPGKPWLQGLTNDGICEAYLTVLAAWMADKADQDLNRRLRLLEDQIDRRDLWDSPPPPPGRPVLIDEALALALYGRD